MSSQSYSNLYAGRKSPQDSGARWVDMTPIRSRVLLSSSAFRHQSSVCFACVRVLYTDMMREPETSGLFAARKPFSKRVGPARCEIGCRWVNLYELANVVGVRDTMHHCVFEFGSVSAKRRFK